MSWAIQTVEICVSALIQLLNLSVLVRGQFRRFPIFSSYLAILFGFTVATASLLFETPASPSFYAKVYWVGDLILNTLLAAVVLDLIYHAMESDPKRGPTIWLLILSALVVVGVSYFFSASPNRNFTMSTFTRSLGFWAALLNLILWIRLIRLRTSQTILLMLSTGIGLQFAGQAIGQSIRTLGPGFETLGNHVLSVSHILCLYVWWQALKLGEAQQNAATSNGKRPG